MSTSPETIALSAVYADTLTITSLVVGLTSLILALFSIWLSWQFYKQSQLQNSSVQESVSRIERVVFEMHNNVTNIVQQAVRAWTSDSSPTEQEISAVNLADSLDDLKSKVESLRGGKDGSNNQEILRLLDENQRKTDDLLSSLRESRIRHAFPVTTPLSAGGELRGPAVRVIHKPNAPTDSFEDGEIILDVQRPGRVITGTIHLMHSGRAERAHIDLVDYPETASDIKVGAGFSDRGDFNIHLHAPKEAVIPPGRYKVGYKVDLAAE